MEKRLILVYTGNGKGKTSACVGQALRAIGQGLRVSFLQFMKRDEKAGEQVMLQKLLDKNFLAGGLGFFRNDAERPKHREAALNTLAFAVQCLSHADMLILDESLYALNADLLNKEEIEDIIAKSAEHNTHLVLSGRNAPQWLLEMADLVTSMEEVKHPWQQGIKASKGIEF